MSDRDPAGVQRRVERLQEQLAQRHVNDPVLRAAQGELAGIVDRLRLDAAQLRDAQAALDADRQRLREELTRSEELFQVAPEPWVRTDTDGIIRQANAAAVELFVGYPADRASRAGFEVRSWRPGSRARSCEQVQSQQGQRLDDRDHRPAVGATRAS